MDTPPRTPESITGARGNCGVSSNYFVDTDGDVAMPGTSSCTLGMTMTTRWWGDDKRAEVDFPPFEEYSVYWSSPFGSPTDPDFNFPRVPVENPKDHDNPRIGKVTYLADFPHALEAESIMRAMAILVRPIMEEHKWSVDLLTEFYPDNERLWGRNENWGEAILVRLRDPKDKNKFFPRAEILSTVLHELVHNWYNRHHGNFLALWSSLNTRFGADTTLSDEYRESARNERNLPIQHPKGHISIFMMGNRLFLAEEAYKKHFSIWAKHHQEQDNQMLQSGQPLEESRSVYIDLNYRGPEHCIYARFVQLARGLDPAIDKPLTDLPNCKDFELIEDFYPVTKTDAMSALGLYLKMYTVGIDCGMHASTKAWLIEHINEVLWMGPKVDGTKWFRLFRKKSESPHDRHVWVFPSDRKEAARFLVLAMCLVYYYARTPETQCLRDLAIARVAHLAANEEQAALYFDCRFLTDAINENYPAKSIGQGLSSKNLMEDLESIGLGVCKKI